MSTWTKVGRHPHADTRYLATSGFKGPKRRQRVAALQARLLKPVGWVKPPHSEFENAACWVSQTPTQLTMTGKAANPTLEINGRHAGPGSESGVTDPASRFLNPGLRRDDGQGKCCYTAELKSQKGLTLVEVLVAVAILAIGILAIASMQKTAIMVNMRAFDITEAATVAQSQLELLQSLSINHSDLTGCPPPVENLAPGYDCSWCTTANFPSGLAPPAQGRLIKLAVTANGDTTTCGEDGTCNNCDSSDGTGSTIDCYAVVGVKVAPNW